MTSVLHRQFRSPLAKKSGADSLPATSPLDSTSQVNIREIDEQTTPNKATHSCPQGRAHLQAGSKTSFKSPLLHADSATRCRTNLNVQALETQFQLLKRANQISSYEDDQTLEKLAKKWKNVAKDVACDLWQAMQQGATGKSPYSPPRFRRFTQLPLLTPHALQVIPSSYQRNQARTMTLQWMIMVLVLSIQMMRKRQICRSSRALGRCSTS